MRCIIIEDELPAQKIVQSYIQRAPDLVLNGCFQTATSANEYLRKTTVDIIFLDINLPEISGLDFIKTLEHAPKVIITTAYPNFAVDSFELETIIDYLVKPFSFDRFSKAIQKIKNQCRETLTNQENTVFINIDKTLHKLNVEDILYIESDRNYITIVTLNKKFVLVDSLKNWKEKLYRTHFLQIHKSYIVNLKDIEKISGNEMYVNDARIPIGRTYKKTLLNHLKIS